MFYSLVERYSDCVADYEVADFRKYGNARSLVASITFVDNSTLFVKDYLFSDGTRKYSYHWQTEDGELQSRWDNSPHHRRISTFPHHLHTREGVWPSRIFTLADVLDSIAEKVRSSV